MKNRSTLIIKCPQTRTRSQVRLSAVIFARANHEFDLTQPFGYIFARGSLGASVTAGTVRRNARMHACDIRHRHPRAHTRNARVFVRGSLKTRWFYLTKPPRRVPASWWEGRTADVTFENEANTGVATLVIMPLQRWPLIALFRVSARSRNVSASQIILTFRSTLLSETI